MNLKLYPDLAYKSLETKYDKEYRLWTLCRTVDGNGSGLVCLSDVLDIVSSNYLRGLSSLSIYRILKSGNNIFWTTYSLNGNLYIHLRGLARVCLSLKLDRLACSPVLIPIEGSKSLKSWRAYLYASFFTRDDPTQISRKVLERLTNYSRQTMATWDRALKWTIRKTYNAALVKENVDLSYKCKEGEYLDKVNGKIVVLKKLPTSYSANLMKCSRGIMRQVNRKLWSLSEAVRDKPQRLFYTDVSYALKRVQAKQENDEFFLINPQQTEGGTRLWNHVRFMNGAAYF